MTEREQIEFAKKMLQRLPQVEAPDMIWPSIEAALQRKPGSRLPQWRWVFAAAGVVILCAGYFAVARRGRWIETDDRSRTTIQVGDIGTVELEPGTRLRIVADRPNEHRFALSHGEIRAKIKAPPKLFFVDTASGTAIDLGCEYTLTDDDLGRGLLTVTRGWVLFQRQGLESLVPAGASCQTRPRIGPGTPYFDDASQQLKQALDLFDRLRDGSALNVILAQARVRDTLTLWHLLRRVDVSNRGRVYDRIAQLAPVPAGVSRGRALELDPQTLALWKDELAWKW